MKYFKLIDNNSIIGVISSQNFMHYYEIIDSYLQTNEEIGEYVSYKGQFYRSPWMQPYIHKVDYKEVAIVEITEEEYEIYQEAFQTQETIQEVEEERAEEMEEPIEIDYDQQLSINFIRTTKISEMSYNCRKSIENGFDLILRGEVHHFSLTTQDQLNLMNLDTTAELIPYHADGESYTYYTADEIKQIINAANDHKIYHTAYYNSLKEYINTLETIEEIAAITYGTPIPDKYKSEVLKVFEEYTQPFHS